MDNASSPKSVLETLRTVEFRLGLRGYDVDEVDDYLEKVAVEADAMQEQVRQLTDRLRQAADRIAQLEAAKAQAPAAAAEPKPEVVAPAAASAAVAAASTDSLQRTLEMAQRFVDEAKRESEAEAAKVIAAANVEARRLQSEAGQHAFKASQPRIIGRHLARIC